MGPGWTFCPWSTPNLFQIQGLHTWSSLLGALLSLSSHDWLHPMIQISFQISLLKNDISDDKAKRNPSPALHELIITWSVLYYSEHITLKIFVILPTLNGSSLVQELSLLLGRYTLLTPRGVSYTWQVFKIVDKLQKTCSSSMYPTVLDTAFTLSWLLVNVCLIKEA